MTDGDILGHFESLGDNCEFGLVQRAVGIEPLGFFRFNFARMPALLTALDRDFGDVDQPDRVELYTEPNQEFMVRVRGYGFHYHTHLRRGEVEPETLRAQQLKTIRFLTRKLVDDFRSGEKVFVRKGFDSATQAQIAPLLRALRRYGPVTLLWVVPQDDAHRVGRVEVVEPGLLKGYIDRFAPGEDAYDFSLAWLDVCRNAHRLWRDNSPAGTVIERPAKPAGGNLIPHANGFLGGGWWQAPRATARLSAEVARLHAACAVTEHTLVEATGLATGAIHGCSVAEGLSSDSIYVASIWVWLPADFRGAVVGAVLDGMSSLHVANARTTLRGAWQRVSVAARIPPDLSNANPSLYVVGPAGTRLFSTCWKLEIGTEPTAYDPTDLKPLRPPSMAPAPAPAGRVIATIAAPPFSLAPPEVLNRELIPPGPLDAMQRSWSLGDYPGSEVVFRLVEDAIVAGDGLVFTDGLNLLPASLTGHQPDEVERARKAVERALADGGPPERGGTYLLCKKNGIRNYGHWLMEMFPKAALGLRELADTEMWFVVPAAGGRLDAVITDSMRALGVEPERLWRADETPVRVERLVVVSGLTAHGGYMSPLVIEVVRRLAEGIAPGPHRRLYVPRAIAARRTFLDADGVAARARAAGYAMFDPGTADLRTQIATFAGARRIVGVMGAALTNIVFAPPDAEIVVLAPAGMPDTFFWFIAALRGLRYIEVRCPVAEPSDDPKAWHTQMVLFPEAQAARIFPPLRPEEAAPAGRVYRRVDLPYLLRGGAAQATPFLPESVFEIPPPAFGETDLARLGIRDPVPPGGRGEPLRHGPIDANVLHDAVVHGHYGVVTSGETVLDATTGHLPVQIIAGADWVGEGGLRLPDWPVAKELPSAYYLLNANRDSYFHWMLDVLARFSAAEFRGYGVLGEVGPELCLLAPALDTPWKRQSYELLVPPGLPTHVMAPGTAVRVERLIYFQRLNGGGMQPHRGLLAVFERMRANAYAALRAAPAAPWRKLFISRADSANRVLVNEAELAELAANAGFERVVLGTIGVAEQVRLFAEATHVIAAHGAGLTNLLFCRPGAAVCELQMDCYLHWAFRRLAALRGLRYGCLVGPHIPPLRAGPHDNVFRIEPRQFAAVLADPRFAGD